MAANSFEDILENIQEAELKEAIKQASDKYPDLKGGWMRQDDYSKKSNERDNKVKLAEKWSDWRKANWLDDLNMTKEEAAVRQRVQELEGEVGVLRQKVDTEVTFEELHKEIETMWDAKSKGVMTDKDFNDKYGKKLFNQEEYDKTVDEKLNRTLAAIENLYGKTFELGFKHKDEFGEVLNPLTVVEYAAKNGIQDLNKAYDSMVSDRRGQSRDKELEAKLAAARKEGEDKARREVQMSPTGKLPVDTGSSEMSPLQERVYKARVENKDNKPVIPDEIKADGSGRLGHAVAEQYRLDKASGAGS